jgi:hypothetical protein
VEEKHSAVQIKKEPLTSATAMADEISGGSMRKSKSFGTECRARREAVQDQVVFGGGIGGKSSWIVCLL